MTSAGLSEERLLTREEVADQLAEELGISPRRVLRAAAALRPRLVTQPGKRNGGTVQLYGPEAVQLIRERRPHRPTKESR